MNTKDPVSNFCTDHKMCFFIVFGNTIHNYSERIP